MTDGVIVPLGTARSRGQAYQMMVDKVEKKFVNEKKTRPHGRVFSQAGRVGVIPHVTT